MAVLQGGVYVAELVADSDLTGASVVCTVTSPDLTVSTPPVTSSGSIASAPVAATLVGDYLVKWSVSGTVVGAQQDQFQCRAANLNLISLPDLKDELNLRATDTSKDAKLQRWILAANDLIENITGPIRPYPQTDYFDGGTTEVVLMARWVTQITGVLENWSGTDYTLTEQPVGASTNAYGFTWDRDTNTLVRRLTGGQETSFYPGVRNVAISYTGGLASIPPTIEMAAAELIKHWYSKSRQDRTTSYGGSTQADDAWSPSFMVPNAVMELIGNYIRPPGIF